MSAFIVIEGRTLAAALKPICDIIEHRNSIPILSNVRLTNHLAALRLTGTNLDIEIATDIDVIDWREDFDACLPARALYGIAKQAGPATMRIDVTTETRSRANKNGKDDQYEVSTVEIDVADGDVRYRLEALPSADWPSMKTMKWELIGVFTNGRLADMLKRVMPSISTEETRYYLNGIAWQRTERGDHMVATDGHRLLALKYGGPATDATILRVIIPRRAVAHLAKFAGQDVRAFQPEPAEAPYLRFTYDRTTITAKAIDGTFPDWTRVVPKFDEKAYRIEFKREQLQQALDRVVFMSSERGRAVRVFRDADDMVSVQVKNPDSGDATARTFARAPEGFTAVGFNAFYLKAAIAGKSGNVTLVGSDGGSPHSVVDDDEEMTRIVMPMRV